MARKKDVGDQPSAEEQALHERVYEMMELDRSKELKAARGVDAKPPGQAPIDIFKDIKTEAPVAEAEPAPEPQPVEARIKPVAPVGKPKVPKASTIKPSLQPIDIEDAAIDKVVDEILISEGDDLLAAEDVAGQTKKLSDSPKSESKIKRLFSK